jgi:nitrite reductase (NADH) small subunit
MELYVAKSSAIAEGKRVLVEHNGNKIGVLRVNGALHAFLNLCPHQGGPACEGMLIHRVEEVLGEDKRYLGMRFHEKDVHLVCPWHGWEFNVETGRCSGDGKFGLKRYKIIEKEGDIYVVV